MGESSRIPWDIRFQVSAYRRKNAHQFLRRQPANASRAARDRDELYRIATELEAEIVRLKSELDYYKNPRCWHCGVHLAEENLVPPMRCTSCPEEGCCDDCECDQPGCADDVAAFRAAGGES